jgi:hypothetical protein
MEAFSSLSIIRIEGQALNTEKLDSELWTAECKI